MYGTHNVLPFFFFFWQYVFAEYHSSDSKTSDEVFLNTWFILVYVRAVCGIHMYGTHVLFFSFFFFFFAAYDSSDSKTSDSDDVFLDESTLTLIEDIVDTTILSLQPVEKVL